MPRVWRPAWQSPAFDGRNNPGSGCLFARPPTPEAANVTYSVETKLALVRTLIQIEAADGDGRILPALREAEAILEDTMRRGAP